MVTENQASTVGTEGPSTYIPMDRRQAFVQKYELPDRCLGAALFADISGFTPLTEELVLDLGPQRGAEELTRYLNQVYDALIEVLHYYGGSVISFSGDAITCWLEGDDGLRSTSCALAMQGQMKEFSEVVTPSGKKISLAMKAAVSIGRARRFLVGNPKYQIIDVLAGGTLERLAAAEHQAQKGEVILDDQTLNYLSYRANVVDWRIDPETGERFGVVNKVEHPTIPPFWRKIPADALPNEMTRQWLLPAVYQRLNSGRGEFLAELRPSVALFLRFHGIDYDNDPEAGEKLDEFTRHVQEILAQYDSNLLQLTVGDKGSSLYAAFGAPNAHEDDAIRAVSAALDLQDLQNILPYIQKVQIGISQGRMRTGAYGGTTRRTYGVLGDEVNVAARLMQAAAPGEIYIRESVRRAVGEAFRCEELPPLKVKGKTELLTVYKVLGKKEASTIRLQEPQYALPMVGRKGELTLITQKLEIAMGGRSQIVRISGEAGIGKSRLVAQVIHAARERGVVGFGGECQSYGTNTSYLVWQRIWRGFFNLPIEAPLDVQIAHLEAELVEINPAFVSRLPLLGAVLKLPIPDNDLTRSFDAKLRKTSLESLLTECLRARTTGMPTMIVLEDTHWIDPLSRDLLSFLVRSIIDRPLFIVLATRLPALEGGIDLELNRLPHMTDLAMTEFTPEEAEQLISLKLAQLFADQPTPPADFVERVTTRAAGNPFYIEELLNYLQVRGVNTAVADALANLELPTSLHSLILSRIDQLSESQKSTLKVASVIGRLFKAAMVWGVYPPLGGEEKVKIDLNALSQLDLTPMDTPEPELTYLFKSVVTQEVAYESLPFATRARLHNLIGQYIEANYADDIEQYIDLLAYHYEHSENEAKKRHYLLLAGEKAQANYANRTAIDYYRRVLPLLDEHKTIEVRRNLGKVLQTIGRWDEAQQAYREGLAIAETIEDYDQQAWCETDMAELLRLQGHYGDSTNWLTSARINFEFIKNKAGVAQVLKTAGTVNAQQGHFEMARSLYEDSLALRRELDDKPNIGALLSNLGILARLRGEYDYSIELHESALAIRRDVGDKAAIANSLNNLGNVLLDVGRGPEARACLEEALLLLREVGDPWALANALNNLANVVRDQGDYDHAFNSYAESLTINRDFEDKWSLAYLLEDMGKLAADQGAAARAIRLVALAAVLREEIGSPHSPAETESLAERLQSVYEAVDGVMRAEIETSFKLLPLNTAVDYALTDKLPAIAAD